MIRVNINIRDEDIEVYSRAGERCSYAQLKRKFSSNAKLEAGEVTTLFDLTDFLLDRLAHSESDRFNRRW